MKFAEHVRLAAEANRLHAASSALTLCQGSLEDASQVFEFAGQRFTGPDALLLKAGLLQALSQISDKAHAELVAGGVEFDEPAPEAAATAEAA